MARLNPSGDATISFQGSDELKDAIDDAADAEGFDSRSEYMRETLAKAAESVESDLDDTDADDGPELAERHEKALRKLRSATGPNGKIPTDEAETLISTHMGTPKSGVRRSILLPLEQAGYIRPNWGSIEVLDE